MSQKNLLFFVELSNSNQTKQQMRQQILVDYDTKVTIVPSKSSIILEKILVETHTSNQTWSLELHIYGIHTNYIIAISLGVPYLRGVFVGHDNERGLTIQSMFGANKVQDNFGHAFN